MTDNPSFPTVPRRTVFQVAQQAGYAGFVWIVRQVVSAMTVAFALFGLFFALLCFGFALPMFSRQVIFHPGIVLWLKAGFVLLVAIYLMVAVGGVMIGWMGRLAARYPILEKIGVGLLLLMVFLLVVDVAHTEWSAKPVKIPSLPQKATFSTLVPSDRVLLHMHIATPHTKKLSTRTSAALPPPPPWRLWTTTNMVGTAKVKSLGHGRYEIQMIQPPRISRHQG